MLLPENKGNVAPPNSVPNEVTQRIAFFERLTKEQYLKKDTSIP